MQMKMPDKLTRKQLHRFLSEENEFITKLLEVSQVPDSVENDDDEEYLLNADVKVTKFPKFVNPNKKVPEDAEAQERLSILKNKIECKKKTKPGERAINKRAKKKLKKEKAIKKKLISVAKANKNALLKEEKFEEKDIKPNVKQLKPVFNEDGKIVFSKFDFAAQPGKAKKAKHEKTEKNPKKLLENIKKQKKEISELKEQGEVEKVSELRQELAWKKAFEKTEGKKVKDDPALLVKSIKRRKKEKVKSKKQWKDRKEKVEKDIESRQKKRNDNIAKKLQDRKKNKLKMLAKRGRIIPGFS